VGDEAHFYEGFGDLAAVGLLAGFLHLGAVHETGFEQDIDYVFVIQCHWGTRGFGFLYGPRKAMSNPLDRFLEIVCDFRARAFVLGSSVEERIANFRLRP
jgi:hypothetical protein